MTTSQLFKVGDTDVLVFFKEHSIPTTVLGDVVAVKGDWITVRATDGWEGEAGNESACRTGKPSSNG